MQKGNTLLYHKHILSSISKLDQRKDGYISHRLQFLTNYLIPIKQKIASTRKQIQRFQHIFDNQTEIIENNPQIVKVKQQIQEYEKTRKYYLEHIDEYQKKKLQLQARNKQLKTILKSARGEINNKSKQQYSVVSDIIDKQLKQFKVVVQPKIPCLPYIRKSTNNYNNLIVQKMMKHIDRSLPDLANSNVLSNSEMPEEQSIHTKLNKFDRIESLFKQCFQKKKLAVQKSVSQLQSKLIINKESFLKACQAIGQKNDSLSQEEFLSLSADQIATLFISFGWLNRKILGEFVHKRKNIVKYLKKKQKDEFIF